ncbi:uncharacterized protein FIBRA_07916 [Fibroporia radiculosa]|uniref:Solute carrier family 40 protein n=1 Tax=Fibroporia radiculosa TaxID=599839 RepID=J4GVU7_9APHY|nr:uncharacterized protein FIBRA_07916 [Fibroporia radiculosa]CCM05685.1 predicted protein [Fibroporia radiculosa]
MARNDLEPGLHISTSSSTEPLGLDETLKAVGAPADLTKSFDHDDALTPQAAPAETISNFSEIGVSFRAAGGTTVSRDSDDPTSPPSEGITQDAETSLAEFSRPLDRRAIILLLIQHFSNSWGSRTAEFAIYLFLITVFPDTLLPASIFGFLTTGTAIVLSGWAGHQVDVHHNLRLVRVCIATVKLSACGAYAGILALLYRQVPGSEYIWSSSLYAGMFALVILCGCVQNLAGVAITVAIERDWVTVIAEGSSVHLTMLNTYMRRIDLLCKLLAPLFVSLLTSVASYTFAAYLLCGVEAACAVFELLWISVVYRRLPVLQRAQSEKEAVREERQQSRDTPQHIRLVYQLTTKIRLHLLDSISDWKEFVRHPIFLSSFAISCLYFTVLSFDGTMLVYLKSQTYDNAFLAGMRGLNVVAGLLGTLAMPILERKLGLYKHTNQLEFRWEAICLIPVMLSFYVGAPPSNERAPSWNAAMLFGGMMLSRIGLWAFDLCQLKELQMALSDHPRRNAITALQFSLQNIADMLKYVVTMILSQPSQFKIAALTSFLSVDALLTRARITNLGLLLLAALTAFSLLLNFKHYFFTNAISPGLHPHYIRPSGILATLQRDASLANIDHLIIVPGHAIWRGIDPARRLEDDEWILEPYQRGGGRTSAFFGHIASGVELARQDHNSLLIFSGGQTRHTSMTTEAESYMRLALASNLLPPPIAPSFAAVHATTEDHALDSYQNLLFSIARFHEYTGRYPEQITVIGYEMKKRRFTELHRAALRWPQERFHYIGIDAAGDEKMKAQEGERLNGYLPYTLDTYGCHDILLSKRRARNPFMRYHSYYTSAPELNTLFDWCPGDREGGQTGFFDGPLPWDHP